MKICPSCGDWFEPSRSHHWQKYCKKKCSEEARYKRLERDRKKKGNP